MLRTLILGSLSLVVAVATTARTADPSTKADGSRIVLTGKVVSTAPDRFTIDHGSGQITVEMDDWDWHDEASPIEKGQWVTVRGRIDDGLYERRTIEASSVYVGGENTYYYASSADEEGDLWSYPYLRPFGDGVWMSLTGTVKSVDGREFALDVGTGTVQVDTDEMSYNPLDDVGLQQVDPGDRIAVTGTVDAGFFERRELKADTIVTLASAH